ncbi:hypothetical protein [Thauera sp.]|uniref:hypothetical protein n=1 Tax=Thauera sp. TaxID=1905334 RepID=UPI0039E62778
MTDTQTPSETERQQLAIRRVRGVELGLGTADPSAVTAARIEAQYPTHLVLVQAGKFLHAYDRSAYALHVLKKYRLKLVGATGEPHIRAGMPAGNFKRRLWSMVAECGIPYVVALGTQATGHTLYVSDQPTGNAAVLAAVSPDVVQQVIEDLRQREALNTAAARDLLAQPDNAGFRLKAHAQDLDTALLQDIVKLPRDLRNTYGENLRTVMARIMLAVFAFGLEDNKPALLRALSADVDLLKHHIAQAPRLSQVRIAFEHRAGLAVELGRLVGGLLRAYEARS